MRNRIVSGFRPKRFNRSIAHWLLPAFAVALPATITSAADFDVAERVLSQGSPTVGGRVQPHWTKQGKAFWYARIHPTDTDYIYVDADAAASRVVASWRQLDEAIKTASSVSPGAGATVRGIERGPGSEMWTIKVQDGVQTWRCTAVPAPACTRGAAFDVRSDELASPDGRWRVSVVDHNLYLRAAGSDARTQLTFDGQKDDGYENVTRSDSATDAILTRLLGPTPPDVKWSPDSRRILAIREDMRGTRNAYIVQSSPASGAPQAYTLKKPWAGDANIGFAEIHVIDIATKAVWKSDRDVAFKQDADWLSSGRSIWMLRYNRGGTESRLTVVDFDNGAVPRSTIVERDARPVHHGPNWYGHDGPPRIVDVDDRLMLVWSERDGWGHLYLVDTRTGRTVRQVTSGAWMVDTIVSIDRKHQQLYFTARGREAARDVYNKHLYRVSYARPDAPLLLTPENANHQEENGDAVSPDHRFFVDAFSFVDRPPRSVLRTTAGKLVMDLGTAEFKDAFAASAPIPERFVVRSADGGADIYGTLYKPRDFDPAKRYPVLDDYYPGVFSVHEPTFGEGQWGGPGPQSAAETGAIVLSIDGRGTSYRSKAFRSFGYGSLGMSGIVDHIAAIRSLASTRPYMDLDRVGIYGNSNGGDGTIRALIDHGDFFKVGVASGMSGSNFFTHEPQYGELWIGNPLTDPQKWKDISAEQDIGNLKGKLLILHGEMDDHANPAFVHQFIRRALESSVAIDTMFVPNVDHEMDNILTGQHNDAIMYRLKWQYLRHCLGTPILPK